MQDWALAPVTHLCTAPCREWTPTQTNICPNTLRAHVDGVSDDQISACQCRSDGTCGAWVPHWPEGYYTPCYLIGTP
jgi:hypothetical protein